MSVENLLKQDFFQDLLKFPGGKEYITTLFTSNPYRLNAPAEVKEAEKWLLQNRTHEGGKELDRRAKQSRDKWYEFFRELEVEAANANS